MAQVILFPTAITLSELPIVAEPPIRSPLLRHLDRYQWHFGRDSYWFFVTEKNRFPNQLEAIGLSGLLGHRVKADDGKYYGPKLSVKKKKKVAAVSPLEVAIESLNSALIRVSDLSSGQLSDADFKFLELNKNISEHIANQVEMTLSSFVVLMKGIEFDTISSTRRTSPIDKGIRRAR
jgi:hypothetical protein